MKVYRNGNQIIVERAGFANVNINIEDFVILDWDTNDLGVFSQKTNSTYKDNFANFQNQTGGSLGASVSEVKDSLSNLGGTDKVIKTLTIGDFTANNYNVTPKDMNEVDIIEVDTNASVTITFPTGLPLKKEIDIYNLENEVTPNHSAYPNTVSPIAVMNTNKTAITVTVATADKLLIVGIPD